MVWILMGLMVILLIPLPTWSVTRLCKVFYRCLGHHQRLTKELDPFDHPQSTILGIQESMKPTRLVPKDWTDVFFCCGTSNTSIYLVASWWSSNFFLECFFSPFSIIPTFFYGISYRESVAGSVDKPGTCCAWSECSSPPGWDGCAVAVVGRTSNEPCARRREKKDGESTTDGKTRCFSIKEKLFFGNWLKIMDFV